MQVHLVDATFELFRAYHSRPAETGPDGRSVNAVRGLVDSLLSLLREPDVTHVGAATDHVIESWRNDVYPGYKSSAGLPWDLLSQFELAEDAIRALGITCWAMVEDEADDALATVTARVAADPRVEQVVICTVDKDLAQCVSGERIVQRDRMRGITYDEAGVIAKFGVPPASITDYLALVGDSADGYPGLPGWGSKSAASVLARWEHLEAIPDDPLTWDVDVRGAGRLAVALRQGRDEAYLYRRLATLNRDSDAPGDVADLEWHGVPRAPFETLCAALGFESIPGRVHRWA
ncbi:MAG TPA: 5'-3' exonuclease H3TH domain-containing protein [Candidatus Limnocylindria bacterium]|nr:5'-3' exonuclease H3TH domain-containing protein [Candidatus Limnocylindria bacterium]